MSDNITNIKIKRETKVRPPASRKLNVRIPWETWTRLSELKKVFGFDDDSKAVRHFVKIGLKSYEQRLRIIREIQATIEDFNIEVKELYPDVKLKRMYLGR